MKLPEALRPLSRRDYRVYWLGQLVSLVGTWMQQMAIGWVVTRMTASAAVVGALTVVGALPMALLGLKAGQLADTRSRRDILIATQIGFAVLALGLAALAFSGALRLHHVFVFSALLGIVAAFDLPAAQAFAPELVPPEDIARAVGLMQAIFHGSRLVGPAVAGFAIARWGEGAAFLANGLSFLAVIASLVAIPPRRIGAPKAASSAGRAAEGMRYVRSEPTTRTLLVILVATMLLAFPYLVVLMPYYARYVVSADAAEMGTIMSASGFGALAGSSTLVVVGARAWRARIGFGIVAIAVGLVGLGLGHSVAAAIPLTATLALGTSLSLGTIMQVVQQRVPNELRGRVMAVFTVVLTGVMPLSGLALSALADGVGLQRLMIGCGIAFAIAAGAMASRLRPYAPAGDAPRRDEVA